MQNNNLGQYPVPEEKIKALEEELKIDKKEQIEVLKWDKNLARVGQLIWYGTSLISAGCSGVIASKVYYNRSFDETETYIGLITFGFCAVSSLLSSGVSYFYEKKSKKVANQISELEKKLGLNEYDKKL